MSDTSKLLPSTLDRTDRRGFLECMAWAGTGLLISMTGGVAHSQELPQRDAAGSAGNTTPGAALHFVQISDSHIGFSQDPNHNTSSTLQEALDRINSLPAPPAFVFHTGDITHLAKPEQFDTAQQILKGVKTGEVFYVPGEHDMIMGRGQAYLERYGRMSRGAGWFSTDIQGIHLVALVNVSNMVEGFGTLGQDQLDWLKSDLAPLPASTPVVVFAHIPLWTVYEKWGWGTRDSLEALALLRRFGSVTVLNGHIHQTIQKVEGNITFHTAASTAFPQAKPGEGSPGPLKVPAEQLRSMLGLTEVQFKRGDQMLAVMDQTLG